MIRTTITSKTTSGVPGRPIIVSLLAYADHRPRFQNRHHGPFAGDSQESPAGRRPVDPYLPVLRRSSGREPLRNERDEVEIFWQRGTQRHIGGEGAGVGAKLKPTGTMPGRQVDVA